MAVGFRLDEALGSRRVVLNHMALSTVGRITPDAGLLAMEQLRHHLLSWTLAAVAATE